MVTLHIGRRVRRDQPLRNRTVPPDWRRFVGENCLFVEGCSWRLEHGTKISCSWGEPEDTIDRKMRRLVGHTVTKITLHDLSLDLSVSFTNGYRLILFCDQTANGESQDNYSLRTPIGWYRVTAGSGVKLEPTNVK